MQKDSTVVLGAKSTKLKSLLQTNAVENDFGAMLSGLTVENKKQLKDMDVLRDVCNEIYSNHPKATFEELKEITLKILKKSAGLTPEECESIGREIQYLIDHKKIKNSTPKYLAFLKSIISVLTWLVT